MSAPSETVRHEESPRRWLRSLGFLRFRTAQVGTVVAIAIVLLALLGPLVAPHPPDELIGIPLTGPTDATPLGTDYLGRDVLSRVLWGGRSVIGLAVAATLVAYAAGVSIGLLAGLWRRVGDSLLMRAMDVLVAFPPLLFILVVATGAAQSLTALVLAVAAIHVPRIALIVRTATAEASVRGYVEAAVARGERTVAILVREILPNILTPILADVGIRFTASILLIASVSYLGLGLQPPAADWALMISENREAVTVQPWVVAVPALLIAALTIAVNLIGDGIARSLGMSIERKTVAK